MTACFCGVEKEVSATTLMIIDGVVSGTGRRELLGKAYRLSDVEFHSADMLPSSLWSWYS